VRKPGGRPIRAKGTTRAIPPSSLGIETNDNRQPAGRLEAGVLTLNLEARDGLWYPNGADGAGIRIGAFAEVGGPPRIPGPLIRVPGGTTVRTTLRNSLDWPLAVFGLGEERGFAGDSVLIAPGAGAEFVFDAAESGTHYYVGRTASGPTRGSPLAGSLHFRVDARGDGIRDTLYAPERRQLAVTEYVGPTRTATTVWSPSPSAPRLRHDMEEMMVSGNSFCTSRRLRIAQNSLGNLKGRTVVAPVEA
jgi:hypothetical protein